MLANVAAGPQSHRDAIAQAGFIPPVCSIFVDSPYDVQAQVRPVHVWSTGSG